MSYDFWFNIKPYPKGYRESITKYEDQSSVRIDDEQKKKLMTDFKSVLSKQVHSNCTYFIRLHQGYSCRASGYDVSVPTPHSCLNSDMFDMLLYKGIIPSSCHIYNFPTPEEVSRLKREMRQTNYDNV